MSSYFWYSFTGGDKTWHIATSENRAKVLSDLKPPLTTVLDAHSAPQEDWPREEYLKMKYTGPLYFDWDAQDASETIPELQAFLLKLRDEYAINLAAIAIYATGGRGFHVEIPMEIFVAKVPSTGVTQLPYVYRAMAMEFDTEHMDMKIYSGRKGRMWRTPNVQRENGHYKVQISPEEALSMTTDLYDEITSQPRASIPLAAPTLSTSLNAMFSVERDKVEAKVKSAAKAKDESKELARFNRQVPASIALLMAGENLDHTRGFNDIALQLAITYHAIKPGMPQDEAEKDFLDLCQGLIKSHKSDGRYNTARKREEALKERLFHTSANSCYTFSFGGVRSICEAGYEPADLAPQAEREAAALLPVEIAHEDVVDEAGKFDVAKYVELQEAALTPEAKAILAFADRNETQGLTLNQRGIYFTPKGAEAPVKLSDVGFVKPGLLYELPSMDFIGVQADVVQMRGNRPVALGRHEFTQDKFESRSKLDRVLSAYRSGFTGSDVQATMIRKALVDLASKEDKVTYTLSREGVDVISDPDKPNDTSRMLVWVAEDAVVVGSDLPDTPGGPAKISDRFVYRSKVTTGAVVKSDIHHLDPLKGDEPELREWFTALCSFNKDPYVVGNMLGWMVSCFHRMAHNYVHGQFPLMQIYGPAGSGKTSTPTLLARMFWAKDEPKVTAAVRGAMSAHGRRSALSASVTAPTIIDEFKMTEMGENNYHMFIGELRTAYNCGTMSIGGIRSGAAESDFRSITEFARCSPICTMSETLIEETAFQERCVIVPMSPQNQDKDVWDFLNTQQSKDYMSRLGALLLWRTLKSPIEYFENAYKTNRKIIEGIVASKRLDGRLIKVNERPMANLAVVSCGLDFLLETMHSLGLDGFDEKIAAFKEAMVEPEHLNDTGAPKPEAYKALSLISYMSHTEQETSEYAIREGNEYCFVDPDGDGNTQIDLNLQAIHVRYKAWCKRMDQMCYFHNTEGFIKAMRKLSVVTSRRPYDSPLKSVPGVQAVLRMSVTALQVEDVEMFRSRAVHG